MFLVLVGNPPAVKSGGIAWVGRLSPIRSNSMSEQMKAKASLDFLITPRGKKVDSFGTACEYGFVFIDLFFGNCFILADC